MTQNVNRNRCARRRTGLLAALGGVLLLGGVQNAALGGGYGNRCYQSGGYDRGGGYHNSSWSRSYGHHYRRAGSLTIDGCRFNISARRTGAEIANAFRRRGYHARVYHTCNGLQVTVRGCPNVRWRGCDYRSSIYRRHGDTVLNFYARH